MLSSTSIPGSYTDLRGRVLHRLNAAHVDDHVFEAIQAAFACALAEENLVLSSVERRRLLADILKSVLDQMNRRLVD